MLFLVRRDCIELSCLFKHLRLHLIRIQGFTSRVFYQRIFNQFLHADGALKEFWGPTPRRSVVASLEYMCGE